MNELRLEQKNPGFLGEIPPAFMCEIDDAKTNKEGICSQFLVNQRLNARDHEFRLYHSDVTSQAPALTEYDWNGRIQGLGSIKLFTPRSKSC
jgi:hypothetical protein